MVMVAGGTGKHWVSEGAAADPAGTAEMTALPVPTAGFTTFGGFPMGTTVALLELQLSQEGVYGSTVVPSVKVAVTVRVSLSPKGMGSGPDWSN